MSVFIGTAKEMNERRKSRWERRAAQRVPRLKREKAKFRNIITNCFRYSSHRAILRRICGLWFYHRCRSGYVTLGAAELAKDLGLSVRIVRKSLATFEAEGFIRKLTNQRGGRGNKLTLEVNLDAIEDAVRYLGTLVKRVNTRARLKIKTPYTPAQGGYTVGEEASPSQCGVSHSTTNPQCVSRTLPSSTRRAGGRGGLPFQEKNRGEEWADGRPSSFPYPQPLLSFASLDALEREWRAA